MLIMVDIKLERRT